MVPEPKPGDPRIPLNQKQQDAQQQQLEQVAKARKLFERLGNTEDGVQFLRFIYEVTGMRQSCIVINKQVMNVSQELSLVIAGRQEVWRDIRPYLSNELFVKVECPEAPKVEAKK